MTLRRRRWPYFVPAALILFAAILVRLTGAGDEPTNTAAPPVPPPSTSTVPATVATTAATAAAEQAPHEPEDAAPVDLNLTTLQRQTPHQVAAAWGCAYWAHPRGETAEALAQRLSPLATPEMTAAAEQLRLPDYGADVVEVYPGATERGAKPNTYSVGCHTVTTGPDGAPTAPPTVVLPEVTVTVHHGQWVVSGATVGGLVLP